MPTYNVLSLDGGGARGVVTAVLVRALHEQAPGFLDAVDLFAGSSIGAANAVSLALPGHDPEGMVRFYTEKGRLLFEKPYQPPSLIGEVLGFLASVPYLGPLVTDLEQLVYPKWDNAGLRRALAEYFATASTLGHVPRRVMVTTLKLSGHMQGSAADVVVPLCLTNFPSSKDLDLPVPDALLRSMSAPTYFESAPGGYVDGGVFATNPSLAALGVAIREGGQALRDVRLLSIGTGVASDGVDERGSLAWGAIKWGQRFPDITSTAVSEFDGVQCATLLGDGYRRLDITLPRPFAMDDSGSIPELIQIAKAAVGSRGFTDALAFVRQHFSPRAQLS